MIGDRISLFGFDLFGSVRKVVQEAKEEARLSSEAVQKDRDDTSDQRLTERDDNATLYWSVHFGY